MILLEIPPLQLGANLTVMVSVSAVGMSSRGAIVVGLRMRADSTRHLRC